MSGSPAPSDNGQPADFQASREVEQEFYKPGSPRRGSRSLAILGLLIFIASAAMGFAYVAVRPPEPPRLYVLDGNDNLVTIHPLNYNEIGDYMAREPHATGAGQAPPPMEIDTQSIDWQALPWGEVRHGLRLCIRAKRGEFHQGEPVEIEMFLQNNSDKTVSIAGSADYPKLALKLPFLHAELQRRGEFSSNIYCTGHYHFGCSGKQYAYDLKPGDAIAKRLALVDVDVDNFVFDTPAAKNRQLFKLVPGEYRMTLLYDGVKQASAAEPVPSNEIQFTIAAP